MEIGVRFAGIETNAETCHGETFFIAIAIQGGQGLPLSAKDMWRISTA
jgi:hypothetical protein